MDKEAEILAYFKINNNDYSNIVNSLKVKKAANYTSQTNAAGDAVIDYINSKRVIEVGIIPLDANKMLALQQDIAAFGVSVSFLDPNTNTLAENVACIIPDTEPEYYTIQVNKVSFKAFSLTFTEL